MYQDDEFEQFLQDEVKQHRMYPSDYIWKNIRTQIHGYRAWPALTFISLFIITALTLSTLLNNHPDHHPIFDNVLPQNHFPVAANTITAASTEADAVEKSAQYFHQIAPEQITAETFADFKQDIAAGTYPDENIAAIVPGHDIVVSSRQGNYTSERINHTQQVLLVQPVQNLSGTEFADAEKTVAEENNATVVSTDKEAMIAADISARPNVAVQTDNKKAIDHASADAFFKDFGFVANLAPRNKNSKFGVQFYVTPSTSYRRLSDQKVKEIIRPAIAAAQNVPLSLNSSANVNDVVRHKPAMGLEIGFGLLYNMTNKLKFKTGLQLNIRQYYIETFQSSNDLASLSLINNRGVETINFYSPYNNNTGYKKTQLDNRVYQMSLPIGVQWEVLQGKHLGINAEASVQPTLTLNTNTYLLSTDYKHYTTGNDLIRKWNINTSMGFNISYKSGSLLYMVGPQVRYQHLPTYSNLYPIKEYLLDYGIRFGITKEIR